MDVAKENLKSDLQLAKQIIDSVPNSNQFGFSEMIANGVVGVVKAETDEKGDLRIYDIVIGQQYSIMFALCKDTILQNQKIPKGGIMATGDVMYQGGVPIILVHTPRYQTNIDSLGQIGHYYAAVTMLHEMRHALQRVMAKRNNTVLDKSGARLREAEAFTYEIQFIDYCFRANKLEYPKISCKQLPKPNDPVFKKYGPFVDLALLKICGIDFFLDKVYKY